MAKPTTRSDILIVEDDADLREAVCGALELQGYKVAMASNGREAWEWLHSAPPPTLVLLDLMMPVMSGVELLGLLRADARLRTLPVVVVSAFGSMAAPVAAQAQGYLAKPLDLDQLIGLASRYCQPMPS